LVHQGRIGIKARLKELFGTLVNMKTVNALAITLPPAVLARADEVTE
jgi:hypothetical protein